MATHDYVIANQSGAAFRSDLNNALAAIVSNNSNSSSPATTYAYQWWADTSAGILKIRNSSNNGWINVRELDGTTLLADGSVSEPGLCFSTDTDTGVFRSAANKFNVATGGVERMELGTSTIFNESGADVDFRIEGDSEPNLFYVDAGNTRIGIGTNSPSEILHVVHNGGAAAEFSLENDDGYLFISADSNIAIYSAQAHIFRNRAKTDEFARIDTSGRFLVGISSGTSHGFTSTNNPLLQVESSSSADYGRGSFTYNGNDGVGAGLYFGKSRGTSDGSNTIVVDGDQVGGFFFQAADGTDKQSRCASIVVNIDGTPGSNDTPGRIILSTTKDGQSNTSEAMRIDKNQNILIGQSTSTNPGQGNGIEGICLNGSSGPRIHCSRSSAASLLLNRKTDDGQIALFYRGGVQKGSINITNTAVAYNTTSSDRATKKNFESWTEDVLALFKNINPQKFNFNFEEDTDIKTKGFIAQDLVASFPEAYNKDDDDLYQFNPSGMIVYLMKAIQELQAKVETLEAA